MILGLDTTGRDLKLGLICKGEVRSRLFSNDLRHSRQILPQLLQFLREEGESLKSIQALAFSQGPGSFTGLRIAVGVIQGLAYGLSLPVIPVPTMAIVARAAGQQAQVARVLVTMHAREQEFYGAFYHGCDGLVPRLIGQAEVYTTAMLTNHDLASCRRWCFFNGSTIASNSRCHRHYVAGCSQPITDRGGDACCWGGRFSA